MKKYLVIGNPIEHSLSPQLQINKKIKLMPIMKKLTIMKLNTLIHNIKDKKISGINVTVPFKQKVIPYLDDLTEEARKLIKIRKIYLGTKSLYKWT